MKPNHLSPAALLAFLAGGWKTPEQPSPLASVETTK
jgi:hypothetical protein